jgi:hypothetical protein
MTHHFGGQYGLWKCLLSSVIKSTALSFYPHLLKVTLLLAFITLKLLIDNSLGVGDISQKWVLTKLLVFQKRILHMKD